MADVYFANLRARSHRESKVEKIRRLFDAAGFAEVVRPDDLTAVKLHAGERGCDTYLHPVFARQVVDKVKERGAHPFITDTATLYAGSRADAVRHTVTAIEHGFDYAVAGAPVIVADGLKGGYWREVAIDAGHFGSVRIAGSILDADSMIVLSHVKGHDLAGFGGAIKNLAMGCAPPSGKAEQHAGRPFVEIERCGGCGKCTTVCPQAAMTLADGRAVLNPEHCVGCGDCMRSCPTGAIEFDWTTEIRPFIERLCEYALGAVRGKPGRVGYINFLLNITPDCDCVPWSDAAIVPDIGILASTDPVAIDHASLDLINSEQGVARTLLTENLAPGEDKFKGVWDYTDGEYQIAYAAGIGLGHASYRLIEV
ncbi:MULTISPECIES: DUF362 domain-containing protein [unclassified Methanoculleus]|uniref:DUF362 domain-containing protein n=1 Tax=unclassified Methanoculleus TaxID=2619537 RepID=UPI0025E02492|nr:MULTISPECIES: DUF362 domain-containing protein [unclassified Methanoculleus]